MYEIKSINIIKNPSLLLPPSNMGIIQTLVIQTIYPLSGFFLLLFFFLITCTLFFFFFEREFQPMMFALDDSSLSLNQDTSQFLV